MLLRAGKRGDYDEIMTSLLETEDSSSVFHYLYATYLSIKEEDERRKLLICAAFKHPKLAAALELALAYQERTLRILKIRDHVSNHDLQFFLALLVNIPERSAILDLVRQRHPSRNPVDTIVSWIRQLSRTGLLGCSFNESWLLVLRCLLSQLTDDEICQAYCARYKSERTHHLETELKKLSLGLREYWFLQPLLGAGIDQGVQENGVLTMGGL